MATFLPNVEDLTIYRGDDVKIAFNLSDNGTPRDLTDWDSFKMNVTRTKGTKPIDNVIAIDNNNAAVTGQLIVTFASDDLMQTHTSTIGEYELEGTYINPTDATDVRVQTFAIGTLNVEDDVQ